MPYALLIDDDEVNNFICMKNVRETRFAARIDACLTMEEALALLKQLAQHAPEQLPNVIFLDLNLPGASGWTFFEHYPALSRCCQWPIRVFILSSSVYQKEIDRATSLPEVTAYIVKPLSKEVLVSLMEQFPA